MFGLDLLLGTHVTFAMPKYGCNRKDKECAQLLQFCERDDATDPFGFDCPDWFTPDPRITPPSPGGYKGL
eukprot:g49330.t1